MASEVMKPGDLVSPTYRVEGLLAPSSGKKTLLVSEHGRRRRPTWVLKWITAEKEGSIDGSLQSCLRKDMLDLASLRHPALALPASFGRDPGKGSGFFLRPYVEGSDLLSAMEAIAAKDALPWLIAAAKALAILHRFGFPHRNLKSSNLLVPRKAIFSRQESFPRVILCDPAWWPQESDGGSRAGDSPFASDLHALGAIFQSLIAAKGSGLPVDLERVLMKLGSPDSARRYEDAAALLDDLSRLGGSQAQITAAECFLGRNEELSRVKDVLQDTKRPAAVAVTGEAGMGKSALLRRLLLEAQLQGYRTAFVRCYSEKGAPFQPIRSLAIQLIPSGSALRGRYARLLAQTEGEGDNEGKGRRKFLKELLEVFCLASAQPTLLFADEAHLADALTIDFLAELVRAQGTSRDFPPLSLALSYRSESPFRPVLRPLLEAFHHPEKPEKPRLVLELEPLSPEATAKWLDLALQGQSGRDRAHIAKPFQGHPFAIQEAIRMASCHPGEMPRAAKDLSSLHLDYLETLSEEKKGLLKALAVLGRPASLDLLKALLKSNPAKLRLDLDSLLADGTLSEEGSLVFFRHGAFHLWLLQALKKKEKEALHRKIATVLAGGHREPVEEIASHWLASDRPGRGVSAALLAARNLARSHEDRRAVVFYNALLRLASRKGGQAWQVAWEAAEALQRSGQHRQAARVLKGLFRHPNASREAARLHGRLGVLCHRAGDVAKATFHLEKGLSLLSPARGTGRLRERLRMEAELAEIASNRGDYARAQAICRRALADLDGESDRADREVRRGEMMLLETLGHLELRRFRYPEARKLLEKSLSLSDKLGALEEKSLILNNLGVLHIQENRFREAILSYERAEKISSALGEDPILVNILSNLAVLHAKTGDPLAAGKALLRAAEHDARCESSRTRFLRLHSAGLVDLILGRYASGIDTFSLSIALGEELKDVHLTAFDLIYLGECHLYRGEAKAARAAFERALSAGPALPRPIEPMARARLALLAALRGEKKIAKKSIALFNREVSREIAYLDGWNRIFLGWALRLVGRPGEAKAELDEARAFFSRARVPSGEIHAQLELAAVEAGDGRPSHAAKRLKALRTRQPPGQGALRSPMLSARLLAYETGFLLDGGTIHLEEASFHLTEAESFLIGRRMQDLEALVRDLRRRIRAAAPPGRGMCTPPAPRPGDSPEALELAEAVRGATGELLERVEEELGPDRVKTLRKHLRDFEEKVNSAQRALEGKEPPASLPFRATSMLGESTAMREVRSLIRRIAPSSLPVLITGETGTGKELVARALHGESPRSSGPFVSLNSALPEELLEAELFGYCRGAFTGAEVDRPGLLRKANGGTFFFDEIGDMPLSLQGKILRVLDHGSVRPLGSESEVKLDVRYLFSTHRDLQSLVQEKRFREDLLFRLRTLEISVPPLRERLEDLSTLVEYFSALASPAGPSPSFGAEALRGLAAYAWPGNIRELENVVTHLIFTSSEGISADDVRLSLSRDRAIGLLSTALLRSQPLADLLSQVEKEYLVLLHADRKGDLDAMAQSLGISVRALYKRFLRVGIKPSELK